MMEIQTLLEYLPHRYPMLLVDRILELETGKRCKGLKNVTINEPFFQGHYPGNPVMPGVLIIEAIAQAGCVLLLTDPALKGQIPILGAIENVRFRRPVLPGDQLISEIELLWFRNQMGKIKGTGTVDGELACTIEVSFKLVAPGEGQF